jgi:hypothetical protein
MCCTTAAGSNERNSSMACCGCENGRVGARRLHRLAPVGFRTPLSEPGVHLSLCTGLSIDVDAKSGVFIHPCWYRSTRRLTVSNVTIAPSRHRHVQPPGLRQPYRA